MKSDSEMKYTESWRLIKDTIGIKQIDSAHWEQGPIHDSMYLLKVPAYDSLRKKDTFLFRAVAFRSVIWDANIDLDSMSKVWSKPKDSLAKKDTFHIKNDPK